MADEIMAAGKSRLKIRVEALEKADFLAMEDAILMHFGVASNQVARCFVRCVSGDFWHSPAFLRGTTGCFPNVTGLMPYGRS